MFRKKLVISGKNITTSLSIATTIEDVQFIILEYLGQGVVAWIILVSDNEGANNKIISSIISTIISKNKNDNKNSSIINTKWRRIIDMLKVMFGDYSAVYCINCEKYLLDSIIGFYSDCTALEWLHSIGYGSYNNWYSMWIMALRRNNLNFCKLIYNIDGESNIDHSLKEIGYDYFVLNKNLEGINWCKEIGAKIYH